MTGTRIRKGLLSDPQTETAQYFVAGFSNAEIAAITGRAEGTVKRHISDMVQDFSVRNRTEAVLPALAYLLRAGVSPEKIFEDSPVLDPDQRQALIKALDTGRHHFQS